MSASLREPDPIQRRWPKNEQPMQRLFGLGSAALTDAELLSVILRTGNLSQPAVDVARELLVKSGGLTGIFALPDDEVLLRSDALARIYAAQELVRRALREKLASSNALNSPSAVRDFLRLKMQHLHYEVFVALFLDSQNRVIEVEELFRGTLTQTSVYPREVVKRALHHNAGAVILAHNHPSGVAEPSHADETLTSALKQALALVDCRVLDHFIVAGAGVLSFAERGLL